MRISFAVLSLALLTVFNPAQAQILPNAEVGIKIPLAKKPTTRPMYTTVSYDLKVTVCE